MSIRTRFAPSPTGHVHIGNIRVAIFNWLFSRHEKGTFLLRIEDTDIERSTPEAIATLLEALDWLGLQPDEAPMYQSKQGEMHCRAVQKLLQNGAAYKSMKGGTGEAVLFRIPFEAEKVHGVSTVGEIETAVHPDIPVSISAEGVNYAQVSRKGKPVPVAACLAGFKNLRIMDRDGSILFSLDEKLGDIFGAAGVFAIEGAVRFVFTRRQIAYADLVKGTLAKPLDSLRDFVIMRSDGTPVFHLANVCDDIEQQITHIIRGDDHVENTYRHLFLFAALGAIPPQYAHLPMIVNAAGKPYSKRDGDAFVGDFRRQGYLSQALFNYLTLLGWSPGDDREKMRRAEIVEAFTLARVQSSAAQMDLCKLENLNRLYLTEMAAADFAERCWEQVREYVWSAAVAREYFNDVAALMQSRTKLFSQISEWEYFFVELPEYDEKEARKMLQKENVAEALAKFAERLQAAAEINAAVIEQLINATTDEYGFNRGKLNQPLRIAVTGAKVGAGIYETIDLLGRQKTSRRINYAITNFAPDHITNEE